jgi:hypothetical protein
MHGLVPSDFAKDGIRHRCIAIGNERVVLKNREGPLSNQEKPFKSYSPMPDPYSFDGVGKAEIAYGPQRTADRLFRLGVLPKSVVVREAVWDNADRG